MIQSAVHHSAQLSGLAPPFIHLRDKEWLAGTPEGAGPSDDLVLHKASRLIVYEDGQRLGPGHSNHLAIAEEGGGRFSHWADGIHFSTSNGSNPNLNGRRYSFSRGSEIVSVLALGSCHLHDSVRSLEKRGLVHDVQSKPTYLNYTREIIQFIKYSLGWNTIPPHMRPFCSLGHPSDLSRRKEIFDAAEVAVLEIGAPIFFACGEVMINSGALIDNIVEPAKAMETDIADAASRWYFKGIAAGSNRIREAEATKLLNHASRLGGKAHPAVQVISGARSHRQSMADLEVDIAEIQTLLNVPLVVISTSVVYGASGRGASWTPRFHEKLSDVCQALGVPLLHPHELVSEFGAGRALTDDRVHYTAEFSQFMAGRLLEIINHVERAV